jgi:hypothetical protein
MCSQFRGTCISSSLCVSYDSSHRPTDCERKGTGAAMKSELTTLSIEVTGNADSDDEDVARATMQLRRELLDLDVGAVEVPSAGEAPQGTRGVDLAAVGALAVTIANSGLLNAVVTAVKSWLSRSQRRQIKLVIDGDVLELTGLSSDEQRRLTDAWLRRHEG